MKTKLIATLALTLGVSMLASCGSVISFPDRATDPDVSLWEEPETEAPSEPRDLQGIWHTDGSGTVFRFGENGVLTVWSLTTGYDYEYSTFATGSYTYDGETLTMTLGDEHVSHVCHVKDGQLTFDTGLVLTLRTEEPAEHPSYAYPDFEALALQAILPVSGKLTGQTVSAPGYRLKAQIQMKEAFYSGKTPEKLTEGTAQLGDRVDIDYTGKLDGVAFEGGTAEGQTVTVAPDTGYIPGFCEGIAGHAVGETFDVTVTFPEAYGNSDLAGKEAVFTMTLNAIYDMTVTDEAVASFEDNSYTTVAEWEQALYQELLAEDIWELLPEFTDFKDESDAYLYFYQDMLDYYHYYAAYYGMNFEMFLALYAGTSVSAMEASSREAARTYLLAAAVVRALEITPDAEWLQDFTEGYVASYVRSGYTEEEARELITTAGDARNKYRAALLLDLAADYLVEHNSFTE